jgi:transcriptional regulator with XRE-family HTH domain
MGKVRFTKDLDIPDLEERIKRSREADGRTITDLSARSGMTAANWYRIERGEASFIPVETLKRMQKVLLIDFFTN